MVACNCGGLIFLISIANYENEILVYFLSGVD